VRVFQGIGTVALDAAQRALSLSIGRERQNQRRTAFAACRSFSLSHSEILASVQNFVNSKKGLRRLAFRRCITCGNQLVHCKNQKDTRSPHTPVKVGRRPKSYLPTGIKQKEEKMKEAAN
jgi:hypothetical protein